MEIKKAHFSLALKKQHCYISAYDDFFVFGEVNESLYVNYVKIYAYKIAPFYLHLREIANFLSDANEYVTSKIEISEIDGIKIFWKGKSVRLEDNTIVKTINFLKDNEIDLNFEADISFIESLFIGLKHILLSTLRLTNEQKWCLFIISEEERPNLDLFLSNFLAFETCLAKQLTYSNTNSYELYCLYRFYIAYIKIINEINELYR